MPFRNQVHVDALLSNISIKYRNTELVAMQVFPEVPVKKDSDLFRVYDRDFRIPETARANKSVANQHFWEVSNSTYNLEDHALKDYVSDDDADNYDMADLRADTVEELSDKLLMRLEKSVADLFTTTNWSLNVSLAAANDWAAANTTVSDPVPYFDTGATTIIRNGGIKPNFAIMPRAAFVGAKNHISVLDRVKYTSGEVTKNIIAGLLDVQELLVPAAGYDTAPKGLGPSITSIWGDIAFIGYKPESAGPKRASAGYIFRKNVPMVRRWMDDERNAEAIEVRMKYQARVVASLCGFLIKDVG